MESFCLSTVATNVWARGYSLENLDELADERDRLRVQEREALDRLNDSRAKLSRVRIELQNLRKTRDELNETVKALKKSRDELRESARKSLASLKDIHKVSKNLREGTQAQHELTELEWKIQTSSLEKEEEKRLMARIRVLETKVGAQKRTRNLQDNVTKNRLEADELHVRVQELAARSQAHHEDTVKLGEVFQALKSIADEQRKALDEVRARSSEIRQKFFSMRTVTAAAERKAQMEKEKAHKQSLREEAKRKLSQGGRVSLEELEALYGDDE